MINRGVYPNLSSEAYHADKNSLSRTSILDFKHSAKRYWSKHLNADRPIEEENDDFNFGTAFHTLILEHDTFVKEYGVKPKHVTIKDSGREAHEEHKKFLAENSHKKWLKKETYDLLMAMQATLKGNERGMKLIQDAVYECSFFWEDKDTGLMLKARPDILQSGIYIDLKTISDATSHNYQREMVKYGYHIQAAMVRDAVLELQGEKMNAAINICVEKKYPCSIGIYIIDEAAIDAGEAEYKATLVDIKHAIVHNYFPDLEIQTIGLPAWHKS